MEENNSEMTPRESERAALVNSARFLKFIASALERGDNPTVLKDRFIKVNNQAAEEIRRNPRGKLPAIPREADILNKLVGLLEASSGTLTLGWDIDSLPDVANGLYEKK